jgi:Uma2 family endonuclease
MRARHHRFTLREYVALERTSNLRHEFFEGEVFALAGGTPEHAALAATVIGELGRQLEGKPCRPYTSDLRIRVPATGLCTYPDLSVVCGKPETDPDDANSVVNPKVLVEVLSDSTEAYDRAEKFDSFRTLPSLEEYVLVSHREALIEVFRRTATGPWSRLEARAHAAAKLASLGCELSVDRVYAGVALHGGS